MSSSFRKGAIESVGSLMMPDIVGTYDEPNDVPEWKWIEDNASFAHIQNDGDTWEFMLNLSREFADVPARLAPVLDEARQLKLSYLIVHQG